MKPLWKGAQYILVMFVLHSFITKIMQKKALPYLSGAGVIWVIVFTFIAIQSFFFLLNSTSADGKHVPIDLPAGPFCWNSLPLPLCRYSPCSHYFPLCPKCIVTGLYESRDRDLRVAVVAPARLQTLASIWVGSIAQQHGSSRGQCTAFRADWCD